MLECYKNFIGIRALCEEDKVKPRSGLYIDNLPGVSIENAGLVSQRNGEGEKLLLKCIHNACEDTIQDALNYSNGRSRLISTHDRTKIFMHNKFEKKALSNLSGEHGLNIEFKKPSLFQLSNMEIKAVYLKAADDVENATLKLVTEHETVSITGVNLVANKVVKIDNSEFFPFISNAFKLNILVDHDEADFYPAYIPTDGCVSCGGGAAKTYFYDSDTTLKVSGGYGVGADISLVCNLDSIKCYLTNELKRAILYRAGMNLALESKFSKRTNFYRLSGTADDALAYFTTEYENSLAAVIKSVISIIKGLDKNCFSCGSLIKIPTYF